MNNHKYIYCIVCFLIFSSHTIFAQLKIFDNVMKVRLQAMMSMQIFTSAIMTKTNTVLDRVEKLKAKQNERELSSYNSTVMVFVLYQYVKVKSNLLITDNDLMLKAYRGFLGYRRDSDKFNNLHNDLNQEMEGINSMFDQTITGMLSGVDLQGLDPSDVALLLPSGGQGYNVAAMLKILIKLQGVYSQLAALNYELNRNQSIATRFFLNFK